jgi:transposase-like protein
MKTRKKRERDQWDELLDRIDFKGLAQEEVPGQGGILKQLTGRLLQKAREAEMAEHLGYGKYDSAGDNSGDSRNGYSEKTVCLENRQAVIQVPGDRNGTFEPALLPKHRKRMPLFNDQIIPMYSFGMANRDIKSRLEQVYNGEVPPELVSRVTDAVMEDARDWQSRPLEKSYAIVYRYLSPASRTRYPKTRSQDSNPCARWPAPPPVPVSSCGPHAIHQSLSPFPP